MTRLRVSNPKTLIAVMGARSRQRSLVRTQPSGRVWLECHGHSAAMMLEWCTCKTNGASALAYTVFAAAIEAAGARLGRQECASSALLHCLFSGRRIQFHPSDVIHAWFGAAPITVGAHIAREVS